MGRLADKTVVVIGGGGDLGSTFCRHLAQEGAFVYAADVDPAKAEAAAKTLMGEGGHAQAAANAVDIGSLEKLLR